MCRNCLGKIAAFSRGSYGTRSGACYDKADFAVLLGCDAECLQSSRAHERVHVRQFERWGPLLIPAYLSASLYCYLRGRDPYLDNPFEREAFDTTIID